MEQELFDLFRRYPVWDYSEENIEQLARLGITNIRHVPIGYVPELTRIPKAEEDIDVLFFGSMNERRERVIQALRDHEVRVEAVTEEEPKYGAERDRLIARSKIVLNVHYYEAKVFEIVRVSYLLANRRFVISERGNDSAQEAEFVPGVVFADYEDLVEMCIDFLERPGDRARIAGAGFELMTQRPQAEHLKAVLEEASSGPGPRSFPEHEASLCVWSAPLLEAGEEAADARQAVLGLDELGFAVKADPVKCRGQQEELPPEEFGALERMAGRSIAEDFVHVQHVEPRFYQVTPDAAANIGRATCGTDRIPAEWVMRCNVLDEVWLPSDFALEAFAFSGVDRSRLYKAPPSIDVEQFGEHVEPVKMDDRRSFMFLSVLDWSARSGWGILLRAYMEEFSAEEDVGLVLKFLLPPGVTEQMVAEEVRSYLKEALQLSGAIPKLNVHLDPVCPGLYRAADAFVLPSRAEGLGRHCLEAMASGLPVIATGWGGQTEFMRLENSYPVRYSLVDVPDPIAADEPELEGARWAEPSAEHLRAIMRQVFENREEAKAKGRAAQEHIAAKYSRERVARQVKERLETIFEKVKAKVGDEGVRTADRGPRITEGEEVEAPEAVAAQT